MTTILAKQNASEVVVYADLQVTTNRKFLHEEMTKVTQRGQYLLAGSGLSSYCDVFQHIWSPPTPTATDKKDLYHFMIAKVIPSLKKCFKENDLKVESDKDDETRFAFLIVVGGQVFDIAEDFAVTIDKDGIYGVGSGSSFAIGALKAGASMEQAMQIAHELDPYTSAEFQVFNA